MTTPNSGRHLVDPELLRFLDLVPRFELSDETLPEVRKGGFAFPADPEVSAKVATSSHIVRGPEGAPPVELIAYRPLATEGRLPSILHVHGGGFVGGRADAHAGKHQALALELNCAIITVEYRLAPETPFPGAVEDCYAALAWLFEQPEAVGVDLERVGVMGESAGGGLAAALALLARDRGEYPLAFQHLIYPMLDDRTSAGRSLDPHPGAGELILTHPNNRYAWRSLLGAEPGSEGVSPYAAPARAESLAGLPATFLLTGALDLFLEEDMDFARRLIRAGVPVELHVFPGAFHGFDVAPDVDVSKRARRDSRAALKRALHPTPAGSAENSAA
ncbi:MAG: arylesterase [Phenylobacterium sp.]|jgi:acetyl esterase/lipase|nr:arylesterase [Phenylobacterium sp.]